MRTVFACLKLFGFLLLALAVIPVQGPIALLARGKMVYIIPRYWHMAVARVIGIRFRVVGQPAYDHQTLYMSNHLSYLDIPVIGGILKCSFVAKSEVSAWPLFGFLSKLQRTVFIQRKKTAARTEKNALQQRVADGESLIIFPEGTSTDGREVLPFKSSLFSLAKSEDAPDIYVQPMTIKILEVDGRNPQTQDDRDLYAWHINMTEEVPEHLWRFAKTKGALLEITFHEPLKAKDFADRKILAKTCYESVSSGLETAAAA